MLPTGFVLGLALVNAAIIAVIAVVVGSASSRLFRQAWYVRTAIVDIATGLLFWIVVLFGLIAIERTQGSAITLSDGWMFGLAACAVLVRHAVRFSRRGK